MLMKLVEKKGKNWDRLLGPILLAYRTSPHSSSGETPFFLMYGRDCRIPTGLDIYVPRTSCPTVETQGRRSLFLCGQAIRANLGGLGYIVKVDTFSHCAKHNQHA